MKFLALSHFVKNFLFVFGLLAFIKCDIGFVTKFKCSMMINILDNFLCCCYFIEYVIILGSGCRENRFVFFWVYIFDMPAFSMINHFQLKKKQFLEIIYL